MSIYDILLNPQRTAFDYFVQGQEARQKYDANQQLMQARAQEMLQAAQMNPLLLQAQRAGIDLTKQQTATSATQADTSKLQQQLFGKELDYFESDKELERNLKDAQIEQAKAAMGASQENIATSRAARAQAFKDQEIKDTIQAGVMAESAKQFPEGSQERQSYIQSLIPAIKGMKTKFDIDFDQLAKDGLTDAEIDQISAMGRSLAPKQTIKPSDVIAAQRFALDVKKEERAATKETRQSEKQRRELTAEAKNAFSAVDMGLSTVDEILSFDDGVFKDVLGPISSKLPTVGQDEADFEEKIQSLASQLTMANIDKMSGVLSDSDLKVLREASGNLSLRQSPSSMKKTLNNIQRVLFKNRKIISEKFDVEQTVPDTPNVRPSPNEIDAIMKELGV